MRSISEKDPITGQNTKELQRRLQDAERRLQLGQKLAEHMLRLDAAVHRGKRLDADVYAWLAKQPERLAAWLELCHHADLEGRASIAQLYSWQKFFNARQRRYLLQKLQEHGLVDVIEPGLDAVVMVK